MCSNLARCEVDLRFLSSQAPSLTSCMMDSRTLPLVWLAVWLALLLAWQLALLVMRVSGAG